MDKRDFSPAKDTSSGYRGYSEDSDLAAIHPELANKYHEISYIASGAQGTVLCALDDSGKKVAIKVLDIQSVESFKDIELFEREIETLRNLSVPGVPAFIETIKTDRYMYLVEEYIPALSLDKYISSGKRFPFGEILIILRKTARILQTIESGIPPIIHRDIKPANILVSDDMSVWLVDFGVVASKRQKSFATTFAGTAGYLAPEQLYGKVTPAADIFSLGMTMIHLVTSVSPCEMEMDDLDPKFEKYIPENVPNWFCELLKKMIDPSPKKRIQNGNELIQVLDFAIKCDPGMKHVFDNAEPASRQNSGNSEQGKMGLVSESGSQDAHLSKKVSGKYKVFLVILIFAITLSFLRFIGSLGETLVPMVALAIYLIVRSKKRGG